MTLIALKNINVQVNSWQDIYAIWENRTVIWQRFQRIEEVNGYHCLAVTYAPRMVGYLPPSELGIEEPTMKDLHRLLRMPVSAMVKEVMYRSGIVVLSRQAAMELLSQKLWEVVAPGDVVEGIIVTPAIPGKPIYIDTGGVIAEVPPTEVVWQWTAPWELKELYPVYSLVQAKVLLAERENGKLVVSLRAMQPDPWQAENLEKYRPGDLHIGTVVGTVKDLKLVRLDGGLICACASKNGVKPGKRVHVFIKSIDIKRRRMFGRLS